MIVSESVSNLEAINRINNPKANAVPVSPKKKVAPVELDKPDINRAIENIAKSI